MSLYDDWKCTDPFEDDGAIQCADCERVASESCGPCDVFLCRRCESEHKCEQQEEEAA